MRAYVDGESQRSARSKLGLFLDDMGFKEQDFKGSELKNVELRETKINDLRKRCNDFCKEFNVKLHSEGTEECQEILISYCESLKQRVKEGKLNSGTVKNRKFVVKRLIEKVMNVKNIDWEEVFNGLPKPSRFAQDRAYTIDEIRQICKYQDPRIKPIVYLFATSGIRLGAFDYLRWGHISPQTRDVKLVCALVEVYKGTPDQYPTLITAEAYNVLKEWMDFRERSGEKITPDSWIMRDYWDTKDGFTHGIARDPIQLKSSGVKSLIDSALRRQGLRKNLTNGKKRHDFQLNHAFRKFHETELIKANLKQVDINILQGHANEGMIDHYYRPSSDSVSRIDDYLIKEFLKAEKYLIIDQANRNIDELKEEVKQDVTKDVRKQFLEMRKEIILMKFNSFVNEYLRDIQDQFRLHIESITGKNNGKLDRDIEGFVFEPKDQLQTYFEYNKQLNDNDKSILEECVKSGEIKKCCLMPIDKNDYNNRDN